MASTGWLPDIRMSPTGAVGAIRGGLLASFVQVRLGRHFEAAIGHRDGDDAFGELDFVDAHGLGWAGGIRREIRDALAEDLRFAEAVLRRGTSRDGVFDLGAQRRLHPTDCAVP
jgi:hypothetical protein